MDTVNWRFNSNSDEAIEFRRFHYQLAATIKNVLVVGYHLKGFLFDGHFPHYISLDWVSLNCWDIMRYQPRSHWYLEQEISFVRHFALPGCLTRVCLESWHTSGMWDFLRIRRNKMSTWNGIFNLDSLNTFYSWQPASPQSHCSQWHDYWIMFCLSRGKFTLHQIPLNEVERNCCVNVCKFQQNKEHKTFPISGRVWPELQPSVYYFSGCMNRSRKILWRICGHCPRLLSTVINSLTSPASHHQCPSVSRRLLWTRLKSGKIVTSM